MTLSIVLVEDTKASHNPYSSVLCLFHTLLIWLFDKYSIFVKQWNDFSK
jgi:hypothetical protein